MNYRFVTLKRLIFPSNLAQEVLQAMCSLKCLSSFVSEDRAMQPPDGAIPPVIVLSVMKELSDDKSIDYLLVLRTNLLLYFLAFLVFTPSAGFPHGVTGRGRPIGERPSPPPCG